MALERDLVEVDPTLPVAAQQAVGRRQRDRSLISGVAWSATARIAAQIVTWAVTLLVARLLTPSDYGIVSAATVYLGLVGLLTEFGLATAIVSQRDLSDAAIAQLGGFSLLLGMTAWAGTALAAPFIAKAVGVAEVREVLPVLGFATALSSLNALPYALLQKSLRFRVLSTLDILKALCSACALLAFAVAGAGFWSLVLNEVIAVAVIGLALKFVTRYRLAWPHLATIRPSLKLSGQVLTSRLAWYSYSNADVAIVSRFLGKATLGDYSMAWNLTNLPSQKIAGTLMGVTTGILSSVQRDDDEIRRYFLRIIEAMALLLFPATIGLALVAPNMVAVVLGERWQGVAPLIQILAFATSLRSLGPVCSQVLLARLKATVEMRYTIVSALVLPIGFLVGSQHGAIGVAWAWSLLSPPLVLYQFWVTCEEIALPLRTLFATLARPAAAVAFMAVAVIIGGTLMTRAGIGPRVQLPVQILIGALAYGSLIAATMLARVRGIIMLVRGRSAAAT
jgi:PST family polysaccharide transporter